MAEANRFELPKFDKQPQLNFIDDLQRCLTMSRGNSNERLGDLRHRND